MSFSGLINSIRNMSHPQSTDGTDVPGLARTDTDDVIAPPQDNPAAVSSAGSTAGSTATDDAEEGTAFKALDRQDWDNFVSEMRTDEVVEVAMDTPLGAPTVRGPAHAPTQVNPPENLATDVEMTILEASVVGFPGAPEATPRELANSRRVEEGYSVRNVEINRAAEAAFEAGAISADLMHAAKGHGKGLHLMETLASSHVARASTPVAMDVDDGPDEIPRDHSSEPDLYSDGLWARANERSGDADGIVHETSEEVMGSFAPWPMSSLLPATSSWSPTAQPAAAGEGTPPGPAVDVWNSFAAVDGHSQGTLTVTMNDQMQVAEQLYGAPHAITSTLEDPSALRSDYQSIISPPDPGMFTK